MQLNNRQGIKIVKSQMLNKVGELANPKTNASKQKGKQASKQLNAKQLLFRKLKGLSEGDWMLAKKEK